MTQTGPFSDRVIRMKTSCNGDGCSMPETCSGTRLSISLARFQKAQRMQNMSQMCWADQSRQNSLDCSLTHHWICWIFYWGVKWKCELKYSNQFKNCRMGLREMKFCHRLLTLMSVQTCMHFFLLRNTKQYILINVWSLAILVTVGFHCMNKKLSTGERSHKVLEWHDNE